MRSRTVKVDYLARVEGEGGIAVKIRDGKVADVQVRIFEPPRFFEAFLRGRHFSEVPDITARICGICPVAYQMSSCQAIEAAFAVSVDAALRDLRRLLYCGEWIESHTLHVCLLHAPDFLGYADSLQMAKDHPAPVQRGLKLKKIGNELMQLIGGREIHPVNVRVGGFYRLPETRALKEFAEKLKWARDAAVEMVRWTAALPTPEFEVDYPYVALRHPAEYPILEGNVASTAGLDIPVSEYERHFSEEHVPHSNALHSILNGHGPYVTGPVARYNLNYECLTPLCKEEARAAKLEPICRNPFRSIVVRSVETLYACEEALRLIEAYEPPVHAAVEVQPRTGLGHGCTEAPRGILYHRYHLSPNGLVLDARITPPTAQNQRAMESDLRAFVESNIALAHDALTWKCEQLVRNYDPCISCATHAVHVDRD
jgi:sulfhydrogenase subunit alpha